MPDFPTSPDEITARWLSDCLRAAGHHESPRSFEAERVGTGQIGACYRLHLIYEDPDDSPSNSQQSAEPPPRTLVIKFPSTDPTSRATGTSLWNFLKEVRFYQEMQPRLRIRTPRCYFAAIEGDGPAFALLLEDLAPARQGDQLAGCDVATARAAVHELVGLHAPVWCDQTLHEIPWLGPPPIAGPTQIQALYQQCLPGFVERYGDRLSSEQVDIIEHFGDGIGSLSQSPTAQDGDPVFSLVHVDYRLDNLLVEEGPPPRVAVVDWQSVQIGNPLGDVAYFLGAGLLPEHRRDCERELVEEYHQALLASIDVAAPEAATYAWEACWSDYRRGTFAGFSVTVIASMMVEQTERGDEMFTAMAQRHSTHALDLEASEFLP